MDRRKLSHRVLGLVVFIFVFNFLAMFFHWYSLLPWFDMLMHFLGGFWLCLAVILLRPFSSNSIGFFIKSLLLVLTMSLAWEVFEFIVQNNIFSENFDLHDTISDLFFDLSGAFLALIYFLKRIMRRGQDTI